MKCQKMENGDYNLSLTKEEIENLSKTIFYAKELKKSQVLFDGLIDFLLSIRNSFLQITE